MKRERRDELKAGLKELLSETRFKIKTLTDTLHREWDEHPDIAGCDFWDSLEIDADELQYEADELIGAIDVLDRMERADGRSN